MKLCAKSLRVTWSFRSWTHASSRSVSHSRTATKAQEFGSSGQNWENVGWRVAVQFTQLSNRVRPKDHIEILRPLLPARYAPLQSNGNGLQSVYLTELPPALAEVLIGLVGDEAVPISAAGREAKPVVTDDLDAWERKLERSVADDMSNGNGLQSVYLTELPPALAEVLIGLVGDEAVPISATGREAKPVVTDDLDAWERKIERSVADDILIPETDRLAIIRARRGQGLFKDRVSRIESRCRITGVDNPIHLVASHCKPWRDATNEERLDGENGLLLTPSIDHLFDRGFIGFEDNGRLIISPVAHHPSLLRMGIHPTTPLSVGSFTSGQKRFLDFHRSAVLLRADRT
jgi:hypothetical protein